MMSDISVVKSRLQPWTSQYGEIRYYINDWYDLIGDVIESYAVNEWMSPDLKKIKRCKVWFDQQANIHVDGIKDDMIISAMRWNIVDKYVTATPAEMKAEFAAHPERYRAASKVSVSVETEGEAAPREYLDIRPEDMFLPEICTAIAALPVGASSEWIELGGRRFRFMKTAETVSGARTFAEAYDDIEANVRREKSQAAYAAWVERLRADNYIKIY